MYNGHVGVTKTWKRVQVNLWWPMMQGSLRIYTKYCEIHQWSKAPIMKLTRLLQPLEISDINTWPNTFYSWLWCHFLYVDKLSRVAHFMPTTRHVITKGTTRLFHYHVYKLHGLLKTIISDMDARFTSWFWNALHDLMGQDCLCPPHFTLKPMDEWISLSMFERCFM